MYLQVGLVVVGLIPSAILVGLASDRAGEFLATRTVQLMNAFRRWL